MLFDDGIDVAVARKLSGDDSHRVTVEPTALFINDNAVLLVVLQTETPPPEIVPVAGTVTLISLLVARVETGLSPGMSPYSIMQARPLLGKSFHLPELPHKCP